MTDHQASVERLLGEYRRSREQLGEVHRRLAEISETVVSADSSVAVTVGHRGAVHRVAIADHAYRRHRPAELAALIQHTIHAASAAAASAAAGVVATVRGATDDPSTADRRQAGGTSTQQERPVQSTVFDNKGWR
ncbi:DNA-binding protein YbaB [Actinoalloteichus hoggarensis]|nr:DNA-binding protein YbaB [Actinoalloteichus hoggarensis]